MEQLKTTIRASNLHNKGMTTRTTISMDTDLLKNLKSLVKRKRAKSLSELMSQASRAYLKRVKEKEEEKRMIRNYKSYAKTFDMKAFHAVERMAFEDITKNT